MPENLKVCSVCTERFVPNAVIGKSTCNHYYHYPCILRSLVQSSTCPYCRAPLLESNLVDAEAENSIRLVQREVQLNVQRVTLANRNAPRTRSRTNVDQPTNRMNEENDDVFEEQHIIELGPGEQDFSSLLTGCL